MQRKPSIPKFHANIALKTIMSQGRI